MLDSPPADKRQEPKTLFEARQVISRLKSQLKAVESKPIPKLPERPPVFPAPDQPPPKAPGEPAFNLAAMPPASFARFMSERTTPELKLLLSRETGKLGPKQDAGVVAKLYKELKRRGV
jgi:hypothetical protein